MNRYPSVATVRATLDAILTRAVVKYGDGARSHASVLLAAHVGAAKYDHLDGARVLRVSLPTSAVAVFVTDGFETRGDFTVRRPHVESMDEPDNNPWPLDTIVDVFVSADTPPADAAPVEPVSQLSPAALQVAADCAAALRAAAEHYRSMSELARTLSSASDVKHEPRRIDTAAERMDELAARVASIGTEL